MTKSPVALAKEALRIAKAGLAAYYFWNLSQKLVCVYKLAVISAVKPI